ncbi:unnamed protein product [Mytilus edulis]|uniref:Uncharacterized protein n=1 Tax=Mytilus edulis TaxID=6550 RepID=A0A8S3S174_MYTED|nr:unnamed protein product [Mytilus edulis]
MTNPFDVHNHPLQLINISTGLHASHDIEDSLSKSVGTARTKMKIFVESSLSTDKAGHALTGCDTTSAIFGFGKKTVFKLIRKSLSKFINLLNFDTIDLSTSLSADRELISSFYDPKDKFASSHVDLTKLRVKLATCTGHPTCNVSQASLDEYRNILAREAILEEEDDKKDD